VPDRLRARWSSRRVSTALVISGTIATGRCTMPAVLLCTTCRISAGSKLWPSARTLRYHNSSPDSLLGRTPLMAVARSLPKRFSRGWFRRPRAAFPALGGAV
jgi:hypothetical protein